MRFSEKRSELRPGHVRLTVALLALAVTGGSISSLVRNAEAQVTSPAQTPEVSAIQEDKTPPPADKPKLSDAEREKARKELDALLRQRDQLDQRIAEMRRKLGLEGRPRVYVAPGMRFFYRGGDAPKLTPEQRQKADEAMRKAEEAVRKAEQALREAERALPDGFRSHRFFMAPLVVPPVPPVPRVPPLPEQDGRSLPRFEFRFDGKEWTEKDWETWNRQFGQEMRKWAEEYSRAWEKQRPEFEKQRKMLREQMQKWQRDYHSQLRKEREERRQFDPETEKTPPGIDAERDAAPQEKREVQEADTLAPGEIL